MLKSHQLLAALFLQTLLTVCRCMVQQQLPCNVPQLSWLLRLMQLGVAARNSLREARYSTPPHPAKDLHGVSARVARRTFWHAIAYAQYLMLLYYIMPIASHGISNEGQ
jgi:hypothetical protein